MHSRTAGLFAERAAFAVEDVHVFALLVTGAPKTVGGCYSRLRRGWDQPNLQ